MRSASDMAARGCPSLWMRGSKPCSIRRMRSSKPMRCSILRRGDLEDPPCPVIGEVQLAVAVLSKRGDLQACAHQRFLRPAAAEIAYQPPDHTCAEVAKDVHACELGE